jgi:hypothetical protein
MLGKLRIFNKRASEGLRTVARSLKADATDFDKRMRA